MKNLFTLFLISLTTFLNAQTGTLKGTVTDTLGEVMMFANVAIYQNGKLTRGTQTDIDGQYQFDSLATGVYDIEVSYVGFYNKKISDVVLFEDKMLVLNIEIIGGVEIYDSSNDYNELFYYLYGADKLTQGTIFFSKEIDKSPHKN